MPEPNINGLNRASNACLLCRERKVKCSGGTPCINCRVHGSQCNYQPSRRRKRTADEPVETRLARLEELLARHNEPNLAINPVPDGSSPPNFRSVTSQDVHVGPPRDHGRLNVEDYSTRHEIENTTMTQNNMVGESEAIEPLPYKTPESLAPFPTTCGPLILADSHARRNESCNEGEYLVEDEDENVIPPNQINWEYHGPASWLSICSQPGVEWVVARTGRTDFIESARQLSLGWTGRLKLIRQTDQFRAPEPDKETAWKYATAYFEESYDSILGVVYRPSFEDRLRRHFGPGNSSDDPSWYALRNTIYAFGCRTILSKDPHVTFKQAQAQAWQYFENALEAHTNLLFTPTGLTAVQALTVMSFFAEGLGSPALEYMLCSNAVRLAQSKGLHRQPSASWKMRKSDILHRNWLWWAIYCCDKQIACRCGRPSGIDDDEISCHVPTEIVPGSGIDVPTTTAMIRLSQINSEILKKMGFANSSRTTPASLIKDLSDLSRKLDSWRDSLPECLNIREPLQRTQTPSEVRLIHSIYIRLSYYSSIISVHMILAQPWTYGMRRGDREQALHDCAAESTAATAEAARQMILTVRYIEPHGASPAWAVVYFPLVGLINLFIYILKYPKLPSVQSDVALMDMVAGHFGHVEFVTSSEITILFAREAAALAHATMRKAMGIPPLLSDISGMGATNRGSNYGTRATSPINSLDSGTMPSDLDFYNLFSSFVEEDGLPGMVTNLSGIEGSFPL